MRGYSFAASFQLVERATQLRLLLIRLARTLRPSLPCPPLQTWWIALQPSGRTSFYVLALMLQADSPSPLLQAAQEQAQLLYLPVAVLCRQRSCLLHG